MISLWRHTDPTEETLTNTANTSENLSIHNLNSLANGLSDPVAVQSAHL